MELLRTALAFISVLVDDLSDLADAAFRSDTVYFFGTLALGILLGTVIGVEIGRG